MSQRSASPSPSVVRRARAAGFAATLGPDGLMTALAGGWNAIVGRPSAELEATPFLALFEDEDRETARRALAEARAGVGPASFESACRRADGAFARVHWSLRPAGRESVHLRGRDVTDLRAQRAERAAALRFAEVGAVAAAVAHDMNNVLTLIGFAAEALRAAPGFPASGRRDIDDVDAALRHGTMLAKELMAYCRHAPDRASKVDVNEAVARMSWLMRHIGQRKVLVDMRLGCALPPVAAQGSAVEQGLLVLAMNAHDAMPQGGRLVVETALEMLTAPPDRRHPFRPGRYVSLSVSDTGAGIAPTARGRLFEPFFTTKPNGNGLGLYSIRRSLERCGGCVGVVSSRSGTRFTLYFRAA